MVNNFEEYMEQDNDTKAFWGIILIIIFFFKVQSY
jgi:hypothetical protein